MSKRYLSINVLEAFKQRLDFIFKGFEYPYISFSGGKDSGLLVYMVAEYMKTNNIKKKVGLFHQDFEAQYQHTTDYVELVFSEFEDFFEPYWFCLPMASRTAVSNEEMFWFPWDDEKKESWVRPMPSHDYVYNLENNPFSYYEYKMNQEVFYKRFGRWYSDYKGGKSISILGMRASESLHRYSGIVNKKYDYNGRLWITRNSKRSFSASPFYDWTTEDIWTAFAKFGYPYNKLYDLMYQAGVPINDMRVASPFHEDATASLNMYRVIEPHTWAKLVGRVKGANFAAIYGRTKAFGYQSVTLPEGHTWKSYVKFLLNTLPENIRNNYLKKFTTSIKFWHRTGGGFPDETIKEIKSLGYNVIENGVSNYTKDKQTRLVFRGTPDHTDDITTTKEAPSWKRMAVAILKNDHMCKSMGFGLTKNQYAARKKALSKYENIYK